MREFYATYCGWEPYARLILPERRQREHTLTVVWVPSTTAFTLRMFGFHILLVLRWEWESLWPKVTPFPQMQHFAILTIPPYMESLDKSTLVIISQLKRNCNTSIDFYSPKTWKFCGFFCGNWCGNPVEKWEWRMANGEWLMVNDYGWIFCDPADGRFCAHTLTPKYAYFAYSYILAASHEVWHSPSPFTLSP